MKQLWNRAKEALKYAVARGRKSIGAALGALTGEAVRRLVDEWFNVTLDPAVAGVVAIALAGLGAWLMKENAPKRAVIRTTAGTWLAPKNEA